MKMKVCSWLFVLTCLPGYSRPAELKCEYRTDPMGIDIPKPRFSWTTPLTVRGEVQTAYQILVATTSELLEGDQGDAWNSGKVESDQQLQVEYNGIPLTSITTYYWKVKVFTGGEQSSDWSEPALFITGKMDPDDWQGKWIGAVEAQRTHPHGAVYLHREINLSKPITRAIVCFSGLGFSELRINDKKVGDYVIGPGFTTYNKRVPYLTFDVTANFLTTGAHKLDVTLVDGWYAIERDPWVHQFENLPYVDKPKLLFDLHLMHADGTETVISSDESWDWSEGEITRSWIALENIDLRQTGRSWSPAALLTAPTGKLVRQMEKFNHVIEEIKPVSMKYNAENGSCEWQFKSEFNGWVRFQAAGLSGKKIEITTIPSDPQFPRTSTFILAGTGEKEVYEPQFFHVGIHKILVTGLESEPGQEDLVGHLISSLDEPTGGFYSSDGLQNFLNDSVRRTTVSYTTYLPNDPTREWKGWTQDIENMFRSNVYLFDVQSMYERWQYDMIDGQIANGNSANIAPGPKYDAYNSPWWGGMIVWLPWYLYEYYGDDRVLRESYTPMKRYVDYLSSVSVNGLQDWGLGDWYPVEETPRAIINTTAHYLYAHIVSRTAGILGLPGEAAQYADVADDIKNIFNSKLLDSKSGIYSFDGTVTQAAQVMPLALDMVPQESRAAAENALIDEIMTAHNGHLSTGFVSTPYLLEVLYDLAPEVGWKITSATDYPSWHSMTKGSGNDLMKERWSGGMALMPSLGGNIAAWHTEGLAGIRPDASGPGFKKIIIKPAVTGDLSFVDGWFDSPYGRIVSNWKREADSTLRMDVTIPVNSTATIYIPKLNYNNEWTIQESMGICWQQGAYVGGTAGITEGTDNGNYITLKAGAGKYRFHSGPAAIVEIQPARND